MRRVGDSATAEAKMRDELATWFDAGAGSDAGFSHGLVHVSGEARGGKRPNTWTRATWTFRKIEGKWLCTDRHVSAPFDRKTRHAALDLKPEATGVPMPAERHSPPAPGEHERARKAAHDGADEDVNARKRLEVFVGEWQTEGRAYAGPFGPAAKVTAVETYEWLPGGLFLVHHLEGRLGNQDMACIEIIGYDASSQSYSVQSFYNNGTSHVWQARARNSTWTLTGDWKTDGGTLKVRSTAVFDDDRDSMTGRWEYSSDGASWHRFWETRLTRVARTSGLKEDTHHGSYGRAFRNPG